jgi:predicted deacylase
VSETHEGDTILRTTTLGGTRPGPRLLITGGVHGDELEGPQAIHQLMVRPELAAIRGTLTLVPVVNEAAFANGQRVAEDGLDLARTFPGRPDGSITERTAHALANLIRAADAYIDLHSGGTALSVWPMTGYMLHSSADVRERQREMARAFNLPVVWATDPALDGRTLSVARDANVPAIYAEYEGGGSCTPQGVQAYLDGCLNVMAHLGMIQRPLPPPNICIIVEDPRPNSGHMQCCYPSPAEGHFEPAVKLGQPIAAGELLGWVSDPLASERCEIISQQTGRVLVLRVRSHVKIGDSLAVILELDPRR